MRPTYGIEGYKFKRNWLKVIRRIAMILVMLACVYLFVVVTDMMVMQTIQAVSRWR